MIQDIVALGLFVAVVYGVYWWVKKREDK